VSILFHRTYEAAYAGAEKQNIIKNVPQKKAKLGAFISLSATNATKRIARTKTESRVGFKNKPTNSPDTARSQRKSFSFRILSTRLLAVLNVLRNILSPNVQPTIEATLP
jgi:hypothetical protein